MSPHLELWDAHRCVPHRANPGRGARRFGHAASIWLLVVFPLSMLCTAVLAGDDVRLSYVGRFESQPGMGKHLVNVEQVLDHYALISSSNHLSIVDLDDPPPPGTPAVLMDFINEPPLDPYYTVTREDGYIFITQLLGGLTIAHLEESTLSLSVVSEISEPGVYYGKVAIDGDLLYVPAHASGIRIYDVGVPALPVLIGSLAEGFDDAWAIDVAGGNACVADGAGGLKVVDVSVPSAPVMLSGENPESADGTAEDVLIFDQHVYVASGGAGVAVYALDNIADKALFDTPVCARQLARAGDHLAVADLGGMQIFAIEQDGSLTPTAGESATRRYVSADRVGTRVWLGVSDWGADHVVAADWDTVDIYELVTPANGDQPDVTAATQRVRFAPAGGTIAVPVYNNGTATLNIQQIESTSANFLVAPQSAVLAPGESMDLTIEYVGGQPGDAQILLNCDDPDESPFIIEAYGDTQYLDPGELSIPFTAPSMTYDHDSGEFEYGTFELSAHAGQIVFFQIYGPT